MLSRTTTVAVLITATLLVSSTCCAEGKKESSPGPKEVVLELILGLKKGDWEAAANLVDVDGMLEEAKAQAAEKMKGMTDEQKAAYQAEVDSLSAESFRETLTKRLEAAFGKDFSYRIIEAKVLSEERAVVFVEFRRGGNSNTDSIPLVRKEEGWRVSFSNLVKYYRPTR